MDRSVANLVENYVEAYNARDLEKITNLYTEKAQIEDPVGTDIVLGLEEIESFWKNAFSYDMVLKQEGPVFVCGNEAAVGLSVRIKSNDGYEDLPIIIIITYTEEKMISSVRSFYDMEAMARAFKL